jgi:hypothetical protein
MTTIVYEIPPELEWAGPLVTLVQTVRDGESGTREEPTVMQAFFAADELINGAENGTRVLSARIEYGQVVDRWGGSF